MSTETNRSGAPGFLSVVLGLLVIAGVFYLVYKVGSGVINLISPTPEISLSAYFEPLDDPKGKLILEGEVREGGQPIDRSVRVTVSKLDGSFQQSIYVKTPNGRLQVQDPAFASISPKDPILVSVEVFYSRVFSSAKVEVYVNARAPGIAKNVLLWCSVLFLVGVLVIFFYSFTGTKTPLKNRIAIIFSYCIIGIFLAVPLLAPVLLLYAFPNARRAMIGPPAGLVVTRVPQRDDGTIQWALNIGGYSTPSKPRPQATPTPTATSTAVSPATSTATPPAGSTPSPATTTTASPRQPLATPSASPSTTARATPTVAQPTGTGAASATPTPSGTTQMAQASPTASPVEADSARDQDIVDVHGGLVIPLYVIILSIIGGAINMTRKVPSLQREGEYSELGFPEEAVALLGKFPGITRLIPGLKATPKEEVPDLKESKISSTAPAGMEPEDIAEELDTLVRTQTERRQETAHAMRRIRLLFDQLQKRFVDRKDDAEPVLKNCESFEDWFASRTDLKELLGQPWRVQLLNQYMYLISAPFLAIVAYYMIDLLGFSKQPIIVLISFSVGLISERILLWLLGLASGYLRTEAPK